MSSRVGSKAASFYADDCAIIPDDVKGWERQDTAVVEALLSKYVCSYLCG